MFSFFAANNGRTTQNAAFTCLAYRNVQRFQNGPLHEFYGLKASQMSKVRASSHQYPHVEKSRIFGNRILKVRWATTVTAKELTSRQKEKPHGKKNNLTKKRITSRCGKKKKTRGKKKNLTAKRKPHGKISSIRRGHFILISFAVRSWLFFLP